MALQMGPFCSFYTLALRCYNNIDTLQQNHSPIDSLYPYEDQQLIPLQLGPFCLFSTFAIRMPK